MYVFVCVLVYTCNCGDMYKPRRVYEETSSMQHSSSLSGAHGPLRRVHHISRLILEFEPRHKHSGLSVGGTVHQLHLQVHSVRLSLAQRPHVRLRRRQPRPRHAPLLVVPERIV